jgi:hypothetical protein
MHVCMETTPDARTTAVTVCSMGTGTFEVPDVPLGASVGDLAARIGTQINVARVRVALFLAGASEPLARDASVIDSMKGASEIFMLLRPPLSDFTIRLSVYSAGETADQDPIEQYQHGSVSALDMQDGTLALPEPVGERLGENEVESVTVDCITGRGDLVRLRLLEGRDGLALYLMQDLLYTAVPGGDGMDAAIGENRHGHCVLQRKPIVWEATIETDDQGVLEFVAAQ